jgi:hypothetical protein
MSTGLLTIFILKVREETKKFGDGHFSVSNPRQKKNPKERGEAHSQITVANKVNRIIFSLGYFGYRALSIFNGRIMKCLCNDELCH